MGQIQALVVARMCVMVQVGVKYWDYKVSGQSGAPRKVGGRSVGRRHCG